MYTCKDNLIPLLYSGKIKKKEKKRKLKGTNKIHLKNIKKKKKKTEE